MRNPCGAGSIGNGRPLVDLRELTEQRRQLETELTLCERGLAVLRDRDVSEEALVGIAARVSVAMNGWRDCEWRDFLRGVGVRLIFDVYVWRNDTLDYYLPPGNGRLAADENQDVLDVPVRSDEPQATLHFDRVLAAAAFAYPPS